MVKKRKKRKPKKRTRSGPPSLASSSQAPSLGDDAEDRDDAPVSGDGGLAARNVLLGAMADTPKPGAAEASASDPGEEEEADEELDDEPRKLPDRPVEIPLLGQGDADDEEDDDEEGLARDDDEDDDEEYEEEDEAAAGQMGAARYVIFGFFALWLVSAYVAGQALMMLWGYLANREWFAGALPSVAALPHEGELLSRTTVSLVLGALVAGLVVVYYYVKPDVRQWADEVSDQLGKVKWPTRKEVGNNTVVVLAVSAVLTTILALLDRFWGFVTNLIYSSGL